MALFRQGHRLPFKMIDDLDIRTLGLNGGVLATVTLADIQIILEITLVAVSLVYTLYRFYKSTKTPDK